MKKREDVLLTAEEIELIEFWRQHPVQQRASTDVPEFTQWVLAQRPDLLPKGREDACGYLTRVLADSIEGSQNRPARR